MRDRMPLLPADFDERFHVCVPPDQWSLHPLRGDETIELHNVTEDGLLRVELPRIAPGFSSVSSGVRSHHRTHLDTILVDADLMRVELTWRAAVRIPRKREMLQKIVVLEKTLI
jgi:hypothetical protein